MTPLQQWREYISAERAKTSEQIRLKQLATDMWRNNNPRRERCERSWS